MGSTSTPITRDLCTVLRRRGIPSCPSTTWFPSFTWKKTWNGRLILWSMQDTHLEPQNIVLVLEGDISNTLQTSCGKMHSYSSVLRMNFCLPRNLLLCHHCQGKSLSHYCSLLGPTGTCGHTAATDLAWMKALKCRTPMTYQFQSPPPPATTKPIIAWMNIFTLSFLGKEQSSSFHLSLLGRTSESKWNQQSQTWAVAKWLCSYSTGNNWTWMWSWGLIRFRCLLASPPHWVK